MMIYATGFKNPVGLTFDSAGNLFATDIGPNIPEGPDELNYIAPGADYGYPRTADGLNHLGDLPVVAQIEVAASNGVIFYEGTNFPEGYRGNAFIAQWSQAESDVAFSNRVVRVLLDDRDGTFLGAARSFAVGFEHPIAVAVGPDGALYAADYGSLDPAATESGSVYRITHVGTGAE